MGRKWRLALKVARRDVLVDGTPKRRSVCEGQRASVLFRGLEVVREGSTCAGSVAGTEHESEKESRISSPEYRA